MRGIAHAIRAGPVCRREIAKKYPNLFRGPLGTGLSHGMPKQLGLLGARFDQRKGGLVLLANGHWFESSTVDSTSL